MEVFLWLPEILVNQWNLELNLLYVLKHNGILCPAPFADAVAAVLHVLPYIYVGIEENCYEEYTKSVF